MAIVEMTNAFRQQQKLSGLRRNPTLDRAARAYATYLARTGKFSHTADGRRPAERTASAGYKHCRVAENLALNVDSRGFRSRQLAGQAVTGWKNSPPHRRAMLDPYVIEIGVGVVKATSEHRYLSVQLFGRPRSLRYSFRVRNTSKKTVSYQTGERRHEIPRNVEITHTTCAPAVLKFDRKRLALTRKTAAASYPTRDGDLFVVKSAANGGVRIDYRPRAE